MPRGGGLIGSHVYVQQRGRARWARGRGNSVSAAARGGEIDMSAYNGLSAAMHDSLKRRSGRGYGVGVDSIREAGAA